MNYPNYNALTDDDLRFQLEWEGYALRYNAQDELELYRREKSTGETFDSIAAAHRYVFSL